MQSSSLEVVDRDAAVDDELGTGGPGRLIGREVERGVDDVFRKSEASEGDAVEGQMWLAPGVGMVRNEGKRDGVRFTMSLQSYGE